MENCVNVGTTRALSEKKDEHTDYQIYVSGGQGTPCPYKMRILELCEIHEPIELAWMASNV